MGYCNDYHQYFPTIQAEFGYGTAPPIAVAELGAGERLTDKALIKLYQLRGKLPDEVSHLTSPNRCPRRSMSGRTSIGKCFIPPCGFTRIPQTPPRRTVLAVGALVTCCRIP
jgi:hypothetical protein